MYSPTPIPTPTSARRAPRRRRTARRLLPLLTAAALAAPLAGTVSTGPASAAPADSRDSAPRAAQAAADWRLDLDEDFNQLDSETWTIRNRTYNSNEDSYLLARNTSVAGGRLRIEARRENVGGRRYTSGYVDSNGKYSVPNRFRAEIRARVPMQQGLWPAPLWFRPTNNSGGEMDLVETYGRERNRPLIHQTIHTDYGTGHKQSAVTYPFSRLGDSQGTEWHTYRLEKSANRLVMKVDGVTTATWRSGNPSWFNQYYEAGKRWNLRINMQVGGNYGGLPNSSTDWSKATMAVDYIRTWVPN